MSECNHEYLDDCGYCTECGIYCQRVVADDYSSQSTGSSKHVEKSIYRELARFQLPEDVKTKAEEISLKLNCFNKRNKRRKYWIFFCLHNAYNELGFPQDPKALAELVELPHSDMTKALSMFSESKTGYKPRIIHISVVDLMPGYCRLIGLSQEHVDSAVELARDIMSLDPSLREIYPQKVTVGILYYYAIINGIKLRQKEYANLMKTSESTIIHMYRQVSAVHNQ